MSKKSNPVDQCPWETGELGLSEDHAEQVSGDFERTVDESLGLQLISIRLPRNLIDDLKFIAGREGLGYQPLIRRVLQRFSAWEFKQMAHESFVSTPKTQEDAADLEPIDEPAQKRA